eukprot:914083-Prymnesium_polylepis.1
MPPPAPRRSPLAKRDAVSHGAEVELSKGGLHASGVQPGVTRRMRMKAERNVEGKSQQGASCVLRFSCNLYRAGAGQL